MTGHSSRTLLLAEHNRGLMEKISPISEPETRALSDSLNDIDTWGTVKHDQGQLKKSARLLSQRHTRGSSDSLNDLDTSGIIKHDQGQLKKIY